MLKTVWIWSLNPRVARSRLPSFGWRDPDRLAWGGPIRAAKGLVTWLVAQTLDGWSLIVQAIGYHDRAAHGLGGQISVIVRRPSIFLKNFVGWGILDNS